MNTKLKMRKVDKKDITYSMAFPTVLITIINWNGKEDILECLASLRKLNYPRDKCKILVIDNGSNDGSQVAISRYHSEVYLVENKKNLGYVRAVNQGIDYGLNMNADYVWIFNNDVTVEQYSLRELIAVGEQEKTAGVIAPIIFSYHQPDVIDNTGYRIDFWTGRLKKLKYGRDIFRNPGDKIADVDTILGCSNLIKTAVFRKIGLFRTEYGLYFEETDFNVRARKSDFRVVAVKGARVWHKNASTMNKFIFRRAYLLLRNLLLFELLNARLTHLPIFIPYFFIIHIPYFFLRGSVYGLTVKLINIMKRRKKHGHFLSKDKSFSRLNER